MSIDCDEVKRGGRTGLVPEDLRVVFNSSIILLQIDLFSSSRASLRVFQTNSHSAKKKAATVPPISTTKIPPTLSIPNSIVGGNSTYRQSDSQPNHINKSIIEAINYINILIINNWVKQSLCSCISLCYNIMFLKFNILFFNILCRVLSPSTILSSASKECLFLAFSKQLVSAQLDKANLKLTTWGMKRL